MSRSSNSAAVPISSSLAEKSAQNESLNETTPSHSNKTESQLANSGNGKNLPAVYKFNNVVSASQILSRKYPVAFDADNYEKARRELYYVFLGIACFAFLIYLGWAAIKEINFTESGDFVYNAGLVGGIFMLIALFYSAFKRVDYFRKMLTSDTWYYLHIGFGAAGAFLVILHSSFDLRSINASVSLFSMLFIIISGALGRYLLTLSSIKFHKQYSEIRELEPYLFNSISNYEGKKADRVRKRLSNFALHCLLPPPSFLRFLTRLASIPYYGAYYYFTSARDLKIILKKSPQLSSKTKKERKLIKKIQKEDLRKYVLRVIQMGYVCLVEHLLLKWRILHVPLLYILTITAVVHVIVVHMY